MSYGINITGREGEQAGAGQISREIAFQMLKNKRRRFAIHYIKRVETTDLGEVAERVAAWENDINVETVSSTERKNVYNSLQQAHLPKLDDHGFIKYDKQSGTIELMEGAKQLDIYLEVVPDRDIPWSKYYLGVSAVGWALVTVLWANIPPFTLLSDLTWAMCLVVVFIVSALANVYYQRQGRLGNKKKPPEVVRGK